MIIAIDYDETYTLDPDMWDKIIQIMIDNGHRVMCVTYRHETLDYDTFNFKPDIEVYFTDGKAKQLFLDRWGIIPDIWIEDNPKAVYEDSTWKHDSPELAAWRLEQ